MFNSRNKKNAPTITLPPADFSHITLEDGKNHTSPRKNIFARHKIISVLIGFGILIGGADAANLDSVPNLHLFGDQKNSAPQDPSKRATELPKIPAESESSTPTASASPTESASPSANTSPTHEYISQNNYTMNLLGQDFSLTKHNYQPNENGNIDFAPPDDFVGFALVEMNPPSEEIANEFTTTGGIKVNFTEPLSDEGYSIISGHAYANRGCDKDGHWVGGCLLNDKLLTPEVVANFDNIYSTILGEKTSAAQNDADFAHAHTAAAVAAYETLPEDAILPKIGDKMSIVGQVYELDQVLLSKKEVSYSGATSDTFSYTLAGSDEIKNGTVVVSTCLVNVQEATSGDGHSDYNIEFVYNLMEAE